MDMSTDSKKVVIHIGGHKTGTTSLQRFCAHNKDALLEQGIYYPDNTSERSKLGSYGRNKFVNGFILTNKYYDGEQLDHILAEYQSNARVNTLLLSEENIFFNRLQEHMLNQEASTRLQQHNTHVVITLRRAVEYLCGVWQESVRFQCDTGLHGFLDRYRYEISLDYINQLAEIFGKDKVHILVYNQQESAEYDAVDHMMEFLGLVNHGLSPPDPFRLNTSIKRETLDNMCTLNKYIPKASYHSYQDYLPITNDMSTLESLGDKKIKQVSDRFYQAESDIAQNYLGQGYLYANRYPSIYKQARKSYKPDHSSIKKAMMRIVIREGFLDTYFKNRNPINITIAYVYSSLPANVAMKFKYSLRRLQKSANEGHYISKFIFKIINRLTESVD